MRAIELFFNILLALTLLLIATELLVIVYKLDSIPKLIRAAQTKGSAYSERINPPQKAKPSQGDWRR
jgi:hypothetical protein